METAGGIIWGARMLEGYEAGRHVKQKVEREDVEKVRKGEAGKNER
ncbi:MAG: hypothetical protein JRJ20_16375 [Deltaproteobacteria bacterium]|nr:hypothetical protein [Deltaproteobacteria bacterium]